MNLYLFFCNMSELTWFEKGLRPNFYELGYPRSGSEWIDLIWEGITTSSNSLSSDFKIAWVNWPDLRRDYDLSKGRFRLLPINTGVNWPDLRRDYDSTLAFSDRSQTGARVNWPDLRRDYDIVPFCQEHGFLLQWVNWPDLRRDYDFFEDRANNKVSDEWIDLIWEGITT